MLVGISILVACATFFAYLQIPGTSSHDQSDASASSSSPAAGAATSTQQSSSFPALMWAFLCASLGVSNGGRNRGSGGGPGARGLGGRAPMVSQTSMQLPLMRQGSSLPVSTSLSAPSVPAISPVPQMTVSAPEDSPDTTPKAKATEVANGISHIPSISLSSIDNEEEDEEEDGVPPAFPSINSAQRAKAGGNNNYKPFTSITAGRDNIISAPSKNSMPPPLLLPQIRGRNPRNPPTVLSVPLPSRQSSATLASGPVPQRSPFLPGTAGGNGASVNGGLASITAAGGLALPPTHSAPPTKPSRKVILEPGHSPLDWARLCRTASPEQLRGPGLSPGLLRVTPSMLAKHGRQRKPKNKGGGALDHGPKEMVWMALEGKVYNITAYMPFHPGGEGELLRCAGKDGTSLFMKTHSWVNIEGMLSGCLVGILVSEEDGGDNLEKLNYEVNDSIHGVNGANGVEGVRVGSGLEDVD